MTTAYHSNSTTGRALASHYSPVQIQIYICTFLEQLVYIVQHNHWPLHLCIYIYVGYGVGSSSTFVFAASSLAYSRRIRVFGVLAGGGHRRH